MFRANAWRNFLNGSGGDAMKSMSEWWKDRLAKGFGFKIKFKGRSHAGRANKYGRKPVRKK